MKKLVVSSYLFSLVASFVAKASDEELSACIKNVQASKPGYILKLEKLNFSGKGVFEFEVAQLGLGQWELLCEAKTGKIIGQESEVPDPDDPKFKKQVKITEKDAAKIALAAFPGKIVEVEYEIENSGGSTYEFDILSTKGVETKVEVDAATGKIIESAFEDWQVGEEKEERR